MRGVLVGAAPRAARNRNTAKCGVKRLRGARGAPPTSEGKSTYFIAGAIAAGAELAFGAACQTPRASVGAARQLTQNRRFAIMPSGRGGEIL